MPRTFRYTRDPLREIPGGFAEGWRRRVAGKEMGFRLVRARRIRMLLPIAAGEFETSIAPRASG